MKTPKRLTTTIGATKLLGGQTSIFDNRGKEKSGSSRLFWKEKGKATRAKKIKGTAIPKI
jgi:hypothetical protein